MLDNSSTNNDISESIVMSALLDITRKKKFITASYFIYEKHIWALAIIFCSLYSATSTPPFDIATPILFF
jgi:hypothetical protein